MKALLIHQHGGLEQVRFEEIDDPEIGPGLVRVKTQATALNHLDLFVVGGLPGRDLTMPHVLGSDGAGLVDATGEGAGRFSVGDRVMLNAVLSCGECEFCIQGEQSMCAKLRLVGENSSGTHGEYFVVPENNLNTIPESVSFEEAAAFSLVFQTAWRMLKTRARIRPGDDVFIHGIGSGVSAAALKIVKLSGARAYVSSSSQEKLKRAQEIGADFCYNYTKTDVVQEVLRATDKRGVDIVVDTVGASTWLQSIQLAGKGGKIVTCGATSGPNPETEIRLIFWKQLEILGSTMSSQREYREVVALLGQGKLKPVIDREFPLSEGKKALEYLQQQKQFGKVVLVP
ncbi:zinc-binding dehydrogenase [Acidobacteria bacterium AH-259-D05]|nr:zinc-binding dehydrogenase [Acidobacteria bacterium AH-259-D05]